MEGRRFDSLAKNVASSADRRRLLGGLGGLAIGSIGLLSATGADAADVGAENSLRRCRNRCEDVYCAGWEDVKKQRRCLRRCRRDCRDHHPNS
jgi:hypothetical protein